ncbi:MAG: lysophospholipid acyltransferase family protein [Candidatus Sumerlaeia bacterium]|nr:lysophospholipid acyltransferase family protein [Candidatus Sumerlaeia bacterium]
MTERIKHWIEWAYVAAWRTVLGFLPWRAAMAVAAFLGAFNYFIRTRGKVVFENIARAFPGLTDSERRRIAYGAYVNAARMTVESLLLKRLTPERMKRLVVGVEGMEYAEQIGAGSKPIVVLTGHMGNWELMGTYFAQQGYRMKVFAKPMHNPLIEADLLNVRRTMGLDVIYTGEGSLKPALRHLRNNGILVFLADQDARRQGIPVPFFGTPASTALGPAVFSLLAGAPILPMFALRVGAIQHRFVICPPIFPPEGRSESRAAALERLTRAHVEALERIIRQYPEQYFWFHRRWKTPVEKMARLGGPQ